MDELLLLLRSKLKVQILAKLNEESLTPVMLAKILKKPRASVSRTIVELNKKRLVKCINPDKDRWRFYKITNVGKKCLKSIKRFL